MIGRTNVSGGGGGGGLNFRVIGGTNAPSIAKENDILIDTPIKIPKWAFSATEPFLTESGELYTDVGADVSYYLDVNGYKSYITGSAYKITDHIPLPERCTEITVHTGTIQTAGAYHVFYDKDNKFISSIARTNGTRKISVPENATSVRLSIYTEDTPSMTATYFDLPKGTVWFPTGISSNVEFNALKKNGVQVYPISAKQYVDGAWVDVTAKSYQNGAWVDWWNGELFKDGNQYTSVTGGWEVFNLSHGSYSTPTLTFDNGNMVMSMRQPSSDYRGGVVCAKNTIDLTDVNEITMKLKSFSALGSYAQPSYFGSVSLVVFDDNGTTVLPSGLASNSKKVTNTTAYDFTLSVDTKSISGFHSVGIKLFSFTAAAATLTATVESVIMS